MIRLLALASLLAAALPAADYPLGPDSKRQAGVPEGRLEHFEHKSQIYPDSVRDIWVYVPAQYDGSKPAAVMIFNDGRGFTSTDEERGWMTAVVLDNLIHKGDMPVTIGIFAQWGVWPARNDDEQARFNRSFEYDALGDRYARLLIEEILPEVSKKYKLTDDPNLRGIAGSSSGGIAAFTAAWERPDAFRRVLSFIGSYTNLRGGMIYPSLIRKTEPKPLKIYLQDGENDQNIWAGDWYGANRLMASALEFSGYDHKWIVGEEGHNSRHGRALLPDALRWLWAGWQKPIEKRYVQHSRESVQSLLDPTSEWELVSQGHAFTEGPAVAPNGDVYFVDARGDKIHKIAASDGKVSLVHENTEHASGLMFGPDGELYGCQQAGKKIVRFRANGAVDKLADVDACNDIAVSSKGVIWYTGFTDGKVFRLDPGSFEPVMVAETLKRPNGLVLTPDESYLVVSDSETKWAWSYRVEPDGSLAAGQPFYRLETSDEDSRSRADGMAFSADGWLLVATGIGLQLCDGTGRTVGILTNPNTRSFSNVVFAGPDMKTIYVTAGDKVFRRKLRIAGFKPWEPVKPPPARL